MPLVADFVSFLLGRVCSGAVEPDDADVYRFALNGGPELKVAIDHGGATAFGVFLVIDYVAFAFEVGFSDFDGLAVEFQRGVLDRCCPR